MHLVNLKELIKYHPYHISTFAGFADVTQDLLEAALDGEEELTLQEICNIARYSGIKAEILICPKLIYMDCNRHRHKKMVQRLFEKLAFIMCHENQGSKEAKSFSDYQLKAVARFYDDFGKNQATYCQYLGLKEGIDLYLLFIKVEKQKPRGRKARVTA